MALLALVLLVVSCAGQAQDEAGETAVAGPALLMFYTDG